MLTYETRSLAKLIQIEARNWFYWNHNRPKQRHSGQRINQEHRLGALAVMGGKCVWCGYDKSWRALQIDHIHGGGAKERKNGLNQVRLTRLIHLGLIEWEGKYQLLCANCNQIKRIENGEHR